jgi:hypothetical protein
MAGAGLTLAYCLVSDIVENQAADADVVGDDIMKVALQQSSKGPSEESNRGCGRE